MTPATVLRLGRVSNLPTVWTNVLAGVILAGASPWQWATVPAVLGVSLAYVGGMFLNDAFDRGFDARERPDRPIPAGAADANAVFAGGFALLLGALAALLAASAGFGTRSIAALAGGILLAAAILWYNWDHKNNPAGPLVMGGCRVLAYLVAGLAAAAVLPPALAAAAAVSLCYVMGLTYVARRESAAGGPGGIRIWPLALLSAPLFYGAAFARGTAAGIVLLSLVGWIGFALWHLGRRRPGGVSRAVVSLIAGIALLDGLFMAVAGRQGAAGVACACFAMTLALQRWISGT